MKKRALISVSDKNGVLEFAKGLVKLSFEIVSTGGTYKHLKDNNVDAIEVESVTNFPEILGGRVKTLHPMIHGAILAKKDDQNHIQEMKKHGINGIDLVCVNLYPFELTIASDKCTIADGIENIDIGGVTLIRAAAKNFEHVAIVTSSDDYSLVLSELEKDKKLSNTTKIYLARKGFNHTAYYDSIIGDYLEHQLEKTATADKIDKVEQTNKTTTFVQELTIPSKLVQTLRYGENAHQESAFYKDSGNIAGLLSSFKQIQGKELSYNNLVDADTAWECVKQYSFVPDEIKKQLGNKQAACVIVKHANPCGVALGVDAIDCYSKANSSDPVSSFGGIIAFNVEVDQYAAELIAKQFLEVLIAPKYTKEALAVLSGKANVRVLQIDLVNNLNKIEYKRVGGGMLAQTPENKILELKEIKTVTQISPDKNTLLDLYFAWSVARFVKSNAIILVKNLQTIGIGAGQMSRIDSTKIAIAKATDFGFDVKGSSCASDAFFPFRDNVDTLAKNGIKAIIHPGGSIKDQEVFAAADEHNLSMVLTGYRVFRH